MFFEMNCDSIVEVVQSNNILQLESKVQLMLWVVWRRCAASQPMIACERLVVREVVHDHDHLC